MAAHLDSLDLALVTTVVSLCLGYFFYSRQEQTKESIKPVTLAELKQSMGSGSRSLIKKLESLQHERLIVLFFGSQTGTAEDLCMRTQKDISIKLDIPCIIIDPEEYDMEELQEWKAFDISRNWTCGFFMATYGEGEPTDNTTEFYSWLMDGQGLGADKGEEDDQMSDEKPLENMNYFVFGLGNKTYEFYNAISRRMDKRLTKLGAKRVGLAGEGDDDNSLEDDYLKWAPTIIDSLAALFGVVIDTTSSKDKPHVPLFNLEIVESPSKLYRGEHNNGNPRNWIENNETVVEQGTHKYDVKHPYYSKVIESKPLFKNSIDTFKFPDSKILIKSDKATVVNDSVEIPRQCYHMDFDLGKSGLTYKTGDHLGVWGNNQEGNVRKLAKFLKVENLDSIVEFKVNTNNRLSETAKIPFPQPCSIKDILKHYLDIQSVLKQHHFEILSKYTNDKQTKELLWNLSENRELFINFIENEQKTLACVLEDFSSINLPIAVAMTEILRPVTVRYYSISSSALEHPNLISVTAVVVRYALQQSRDSQGIKRVVLKEGFATSFLERVHEEIKSGKLSDSKLPAFHCPIYIRPSTFRLPTNHSLPVVMVGPGTGVAPFRAFFRERYLLAQQGEIVGPTWLFFGCRNQASDFLYSQEFKTILEKVSENSLKIDLKLITAFSRDGTSKVYVQHRVKEYGQDIWDMLDIKKGYFYICGYDKLISDAKHMATDVMAEIERIAMVCGKFDEKGAKSWLKGLKNQGRYAEDVWA